MLADVGAETPEGWAGDVTRLASGGPDERTQRDLYHGPRGSKWQFSRFARGSLPVTFTTPQVSPWYAVWSTSDSSRCPRELYSPGARAVLPSRRQALLSLGGALWKIWVIGPDTRRKEARATSRVIAFASDRDLPGMCVTIEARFYAIGAAVDDPPGWRP